MAQTIDANTLRQWLYDGGELALLDVREVGQMVLGHILFSAPLPYSRFEIDLPRLVPNPSVRVVLYDNGDGIAAKTAARAERMGYSQVYGLQGGVASWEAAGHTLYEGVNVPSKAFGELVEHAADTPRLPAAEIAERSAQGADMVIVDGRPLEEFARMNIPGAACCPNGELALRVGEFAPNPETTIIVNCAGRTRSIIGAQTLIDMGVPNPVYAMENGTQGWVLAGLALERGANGTLPGAPAEPGEQRAKASDLAARHGVETVPPQTLSGWLTDQTQTTYLLDVRTAEERENDPDTRRAVLARHDVGHVPGGQLVQATDQWIGVRNARIVVLDTEGVRAPVVATWLRRLGHTAYTLEDGIDALAGVQANTAHLTPDLPTLPGITAQDLASRLSKLRMLDLRSSTDYRAGHIDGAIWTTRPVLPDGSDPTVLIAASPEIAQLASLDLRERGCTEVTLLATASAQWAEAGLTLITTPDLPTDAERIDFLSFTHGRHAGNLDASRQYLAWEIALVDQLDADERAVFRI
ncbi:MAG: rhodanese-like domain-containing protein [Pseudomonadota bacterium]